MIGEFINYYQKSDPEQRRSDKISPWGGSDFKIFGPFEILLAPVVVVLFCFFYHKFTKIFKRGIHRFKYTISTKFEFTECMSATVIF